MGAYGGNYGNYGNNHGNNHDHKGQQQQVNVIPTITYSYLVGDKESVDETIRRFIASLWDKAETDNVTPKFISPHGIDKKEANTSKSKSSNDWKFYKNKNLIRFKVNDTANNGPAGWNNDRISKIYIINIDIFALTSHLEMLFSDHIENILFTNQPNNTTRILKSNGTENSAISTFDRQAIDWITVGSFEDKTVTRQLAGELGCVIEKTRS